MKSLSSDCYNLLMNFMDCAASPKIQDNPLYQRYVLPVIKEIETSYQNDITAAELSQSVFCFSSVSLPSVSALPWAALFMSMLQCTVSAAPESSFCPNRI